MTQAALYDAVLGAGTYLRQVTNCEYIPGNRIEPGRVSAGVDPSAIFVTDANPTFRLSSSDIAGALGLVSPTLGLDIASGVWQLPFNVRAEGGTFASTLSHTVLSGTDALIVPTNLSVSQGTNASIDFMAYIESSDGFIAPVTATLNQTLASQTFNGLWSQGPALVNGSDVGGVVGMQVDFGIGVNQLDKADGELYPIGHSIRQRNPSITLDLINIDIADSLAEHFAAMTAFVGYLRHRAAGSAFVANATATHISFSFADGVAEVSRISARDNATARPGLRLVGEALTVSTAAAIP